MQRLGKENKLKTKPKKARTETYTVSAIFKGPKKTVSIKQEGHFSKGTVREQECVLKLKVLEQKLKTQ